MTMNSTSTISLMIHEFAVIQSRSCSVDLRHRDYRGSEPRSPMCPFSMIR
jgi:hypothetical protein